MMIRLVITLNIPDTWKYKAYRNKTWVDSVPCTQLSDEEIIDMAWDHDCSLLCDAQWRVERS